jgi:type I site-specific restriction endonuclease
MDFLVFTVLQSLDFDEATTRQRLIDALLVSARWKVGQGGASTDDVGQEIEIPQAQNRTGIGYADYVLWGEPRIHINANTAGDVTNRIDLATWCSPSRSNPTSGSGK